MGNPYFQFKQFTVFHDRCAMKVGTDAVLLGAWVQLRSAGHILDVGAGSGVLSLMLAQRTQDTYIDAVELDEAASRQASDNVLRSLWSERIRVHHSAIQDFTPATQSGYDLIVSNPPFFEDSTKNPEESKRTARHTDTLSQEELLRVCTQWMTQQGSLAVIYPYAESEQFAEKAEQYGLTCTRKLSVRGRPEKPIRRVLTQWSWKSFTFQSSPEEEEWSIELDERHDYSAEYIALTKDFYLKF